MKFLVEEHADLFDGVRHALSEFGGFTQWHGGRRFVPIQVAEKQRCLIRATVRGPGGHASTVVRGTASEKLGRLLSRLASRRLARARHAGRSLDARGDGARRFPRHERLALRGAARAARSATGSCGCSVARGRLLAPLLHNTATPTVVRGGDAHRTSFRPSSRSISTDASSRA